MAVLDQAGRVGATRDQLLEVADYGDRTRAASLALDLKHLRSQGWQIDNVAGTGTQARYRMVPGDNRLRLKLLAATVGGPPAGGHLADRDDLARRLGVRPEHPARGRRNPSGATHHQCRPLAGPPGRAAPLPDRVHLQGHPTTLSPGRSGSRTTTGTSAGSRTAKTGQALRRQPHERDHARQARHRGPCSPRCVRYRCIHCNGTVDRRPRSSSAPWPTTFPTSSDGSTRRTPSVAGDGTVDMTLHRHQSAAFRRPHLRAGQPGRRRRTRGVPGRAVGRAA